MSKNVTLVTYPEGTFLKSYDTFVAVKPTAELADDMVTEKFHSKTTSRHINEFFGGAEKAAKVMKYGIEKEFVKENEKHLKYLAQGWHMAQELDKAEPVYEKAAIKSEEGELYVFLGQIYLATDRYKKAKQALQLGLKKGKLKDPVTVNILLGQVAYELQDFEDATKFFRTAIDRLSDIKIKDKEAREKKQDKLRTQALNWLTYTEKEKKRVEMLQLRIKDLEES